MPEKKREEKGRFLLYMRGKMKKQKIYEAIYEIENEIEKEINVARLKI